MKSGSKQRQRVRLRQVILRIFAVLLGLLVIALIFVNVAGYWYGWAWTGLNPSIGPQVQQYQPGKTLWDWMQLLIVPFVLTIGVFLFNFTLSRNQQKATELRDQTDREIASDNQQEDVLQSYLDKMAELHEKLRQSKPDEEIRKIARSRALTVLRRLDAVRKRFVLQYLYEANLIRKGMINNIIDLRKADLHAADLHDTDLNGANLHEVDMSEANLRKANLSDADLRDADLSRSKLNQVDLRKADLSKAHLREADLHGPVQYGITGKLSNPTQNAANLVFIVRFGADLRDANLREVDLRGANLMGAIMSGANLSETKLLTAHLNWADMHGTNLSKADLRGANLSWTDLHGANLHGANLSKGYLRDYELNEPSLN